MTPSSPTFFIGRDSERQGFVDALKKLSCAHFGFRGIGGIGKTALLRELFSAAEREKKTPYVLFLDLMDAPLSNGGLSGQITDPLQLFQALLTALERSGKTHKRRLFFFKTDVLAECKAILQQKYAERKEFQANINNVVTVQAHHASQIQDVTIEANPHISIPLRPEPDLNLDQLLQAFQAAISNLPVQVRIPANHNGRHRSSAFLVLFIDNIDRASKAVQDMLRALHTLVLKERCILVCAGREEDLPGDTEKDKLLPQGLYQLEDHVIASWLQAQTISPEVATAIRELCQGVPLLLKLAVEQVRLAQNQERALTPDDFRFIASGNDGQVVRQVTEGFLVKRYLDRLDRGNEQDKQRSRLIRYGCILRRFQPAEVVNKLGIIPGDADAILRDLEQRGFLVERRLHDVIRRTALAYFRSEEPNRFSELCAAMAAYYENLGNTSEVIYAKLISDTTEEPHDVLEFVAAKLKANDINEAAEVIAAAQEAAPPEPIQWFIRLAKVDLALAEGNTERAGNRLLRIVEEPEHDQEQIALVQQRIELLAQRGESSSTMAHLVLWYYQHIDPAAEQLDALVKLAGRLRAEYKLDLALRAWTMAHQWAITLENRSQEAVTLNGLGDVTYQHDDLPTAEAYYIQSLTLSHALDDPLGQANTLSGLGDLMLRRADPTAAETYFTQALDLYRDLDDTLNQAHALNGLGDVMRQDNNLTAAEAYFTQALDLYGTLENRLGQANALSGLGDLMVQRNDLTAAEAYLTQALDLYREIADRLGQANALSGLGDLMLRRDDLTAAEAYLTQALNLYRALGKRLGQANVLADLGDLMLRRSDLSAAEPYFTQALDLSRALDDHIGQANALRGLGDLMLQRDDLTAAEPYFTQALDLYRDLGKRLGQANVLGDLGDLMLRRDDLTAAEPYFTQALDLSRAIGNRLSQANALRSLGDLMLRRDDLSASELNYTQALDLYRAIDNRLGQANTLSSLGHLMLQRNHLSAAKPYFTQALDLSRAIGNRLGEANALRGLAQVAFEYRDLGTAERNYIAARDLSKRILDRLGQANALTGLGHLMVQRNDLIAAETYFSQALDLYRAIGEPRGQANTLAGLGEVLVRQHDLPKADQNFRWAYDIYEQIAERSSQANTLINRANIARNDRRPADATLYAQQALQIYIEIKDERMQADVLKFLAQIAQSQGHVREAATYLEQAQRLEAAKTNHT